MQPLLGPLAGLTSSDSDVESLQTDVMRFLAIIALCLLAVFAAVSSEMPQSAREMIDVQANMIATLQSDKVLTSESQLAQIDVQQVFNAQAQSDSITLALNAQIATLKAQLHYADLKQKDLQELALYESQQREAAGVEIQRLQAELRATTAERMAQQEQNSASDDVGVMEQLEWVELPQSEVVEVNHEPDLLESVGPVPSEDGPTQPDAQPAERALTLRFESDSALITLLSTGRVQLLALFAGSVWRYQPFDQTFVGITVADNVYMISEVPTKIGSLAVSLLGQHHIRWGVVMDQRMLSSLTGQISRVTSGEILVNEHGDFHHRSR